MLSWLTGLTWLTGKFGLTRKNDTRLAAQRLYDAIVAQSRLPAFYLGHGVPDTVTGRFEMIVVHMFLVLERLQAEQGPEGEHAGQTGQALNEAFIGDMDSAMREMGVADVRVGQRMHQTAGAFFGRLMAYRKAIAVPLDEAGATDPLADAFARNVLAGDISEELDARPTPSRADERRRSAASLARYARAAVRQLAALPLVALYAGEITWPAVDAADRSG